MEIDRLTKKEVELIERKQGKRLLIGGLTIVGGIGLSLLTGWLINNVIISVVILGLMMIVGSGIMLSAPSAYECGRCGEYYTAWWRHPEDYCLCNLKSKLAKLNCEGQNG